MRHHVETSCTLHRLGPNAPPGGYRIYSMSRGFGVHQFEATRRQHDTRCPTPGWWHQPHTLSQTYYPRKTFHCLCLLRGFTWERAWRQFQPSSPLRSREGRSWIWGSYFLSFGQASRRRMRMWRGSQRDGVAGRWWIYWPGGSAILLVWAPAMIQDIHGHDGAG